MLKPKPIWIAYAAAFGIALYAGIYLAATHSEALDHVAHAVRASRVIEERVGRVTDVRLEPVDEYHEKFVNAERTARMTLSIVGERGNLKLSVLAKKADGVWQIKEASIDGQPVQLELPGRT